MALLLRPKYLLVDKTRRGELKKKTDGEKNVEKKKRREEEMKSKKVWNYKFLYEFPYNCMVSSLPQT